MAPTAGRDCGAAGVTFPAGLRVLDPNPKPLSMSLPQESQAAHRADGHPTVGQGTSLRNGSLVPSGIPPHHLLVAPASAPSASKGVRWPMSGTALPVPGLSPALATRCRDSPATGLVAAVSRDEEDAWKRSRTETQRRCLSRSEQRQHGWGARGGSGLTDTRCFCFPAARCTWPAQEPHASLRHGATAGSGRWLPAQPDKKGCRGVRT